MSFSAVQADAIDFLRSQEKGSISLIFSSPPYENARLYLENGRDLGIARDTEAWVAWMVEVFHAALPACNGLVAFVVEGQTRDFRYSCGPALLMADLCRAGINLRKPPIFHRVGIPGSGGPDWLRNDFEWIICATNGGKLPWSDNTACGHAPKWAPGGEMSHRVPNGQRINQWGMREAKGGGTTGGDPQPDGTIAKRKKPSHKFMSMTSRGKNGERKIAGGHRAPAGVKSGDMVSEDVYDPPVLANPGNSIERTYTAAEVAAMQFHHGGRGHPAREKLYRMRHSSDTS